MSGLIEKIEAAGGPDRQLDMLIENALGLAIFDRDPAVGFGDADYNRRDPKPYTASIDAAMTLIPDGLVVNMGNDISFCWAHVWHDLPAYDGNPFEGRAATLPLALCAAALRATPSIKGGDRGA